MDTLLNDVKLVADSGIPYYEKREKGIVFKEDDVFFIISFNDAGTPGIATEFHPQGDLFKGVEFTPQTVIFLESLSYVDLTLVDNFASVDLIFKIELKGDVDITKNKMLNRIFVDEIYEVLNAIYETPKNLN